jgi:alkaline phosphatase D
MATWDDHDYGKNDAGASFQAREMSQQIFRDFWGVQGGRTDRDDGIYQARVLGPPGRRVQIILLDTRFFRTDLLRQGRSGGSGPYGRHQDAGSTILGQKQWAWLRERLREPAELRLIATSIQFGAAHHGWESWANFPLEQSRMIRLISETGADGVLFLSGDRHMAELSRLESQEVYPLWDLTSSGLNRRFPAANPGPNTNRVGQAYLKVNFGEIEIDWDAGRVILRIRNADGEPVLEQRISMDELRL